MTATLLDVNVLIALFDPAHPSHKDAHVFFETQKKKRWATTPLTIDGFVRVFSNPSYPTVDATPAEAASHLRRLCQSDRHVFWRDDVSLLDEGHPADSVPRGSPSDHGRPTPRPGGKERRPVGDVRSKTPNEGRQGSD